MTLLDIFPGKKTYLLVLGGFLGVGAAMFTGDLSVADGVRDLVALAIAGTIRKGIKAGKV